MYIDSVFVELILLDPFPAVCRINSIDIISPLLEYCYQK